MRILYIEPFEGGSHAQFTRALTGADWARWTKLTLPARHWKWRMRGASSYFALEHREVLEAPYDLVFASAYLSLAELRGLVPKLSALPTILYFHENQLTYPVQEGREDPRDLHFGFTQMIAALAASRCVFNSDHNRDSFMREARATLARMPDAVPGDWVDRLERKSEVLPVPLDLPEVGELGERPGADRTRGPLVLWNHRWEYDKGPERFFAVLERLAAADVPFRLAVCGHQFRTVPRVFERARKVLAARIEHWGTLVDRDEYLALMQRAQLCVSTATHEFFGISMLEATHCGARPVVPHRLAYPEHFGSEFLYRDDEELEQTLTRLCREWTAGTVELRADRRAIPSPYATAEVLPRYRACCEAVASER